jgi:Ser/Thr protein kinase RdoA (MazF antagonist)
MVTKTPAGEIRQILDEQYGLKMGKVLRRLQGISNYGLVTSSNIGQLTIRISDSSLLVAAIVLEDQVTSFLYSQGVPARTVVKTNTGAPYVVTSSGRVITVFRFIYGDYLKEVTPAEITKVGQFLESLHKAMAAFTGNKGQPLLFSGRLLEVHNSQIDPPKIAVLNKDLLAAADQEPQLIHGDFNPGNFIFSGSQVSGVFDFEHTGQGSIYWDLATLSAHWLFFLPHLSPLTILEALYSGYGLDSKQRLVATETTKLMALWLWAVCSSSVPNTDLAYYEGDTAYHKTRVEELFSSCNS